MRETYRHATKQCEHPEIEIDLATGKRWCTSCHRLVLDSDPVEFADPPRRSIRTLFEIRGRTWFMIGVGAAFGVAVYVLLRVLP